ALILRDDDTCALTPPAYLETVYGPAWEKKLPVSLSVVPRIIGSHNPNIPPSERGTGKEYVLTEESPVFSLLHEKQQEGLVDIVQHGYFHTTNLDLRYPPFGETTGYTRELLQQSSEFYGASNAEIRERITKGKKHLEDLFGAGSVRSFVAPQEYLTPSLWKELVAQGFVGYSGGIRPQFWEYVPVSAVSAKAFMGLVSAVIRRTSPAFLGEQVAKLTPQLPLLPATYRHYWSGYQTPEQAASTLAEGKRILHKKYEDGEGYFLLLTHYWEYFGDWQKAPTQNLQLEGLHDLFAEMASLEGAWPCTLTEYSEYIRQA
ncbi:MAG TPA: DUF2334 domain-containing protein, partial [Verrucomicrobiae bacterium]|nr:DUF2334 domain-containing protein [Verrucomicrobiae bacterium]